MKKQEKIDLLRKGIAEKEICRCYFSYEPSFFYCYPNEVNDKFILGQEEDDFILDGYFIRKLTHLKKLEITQNKCNEINRMLGITDQVVHPGIDISSWRSIFQGLSALDTYVIIEDCINDKFIIGVIEKVLKDRLYFRHFNGLGKWDEAAQEIRYSEITGVEWLTRYDREWKKYLEREKP